MTRILIALLVATPAWAQGNAVREALANVTLGTPIERGEAILIPLVLAGAPQKTDVVSTFSSPAEFAEPKKPARKYNVVLHNPGKQPLLVPGGTVIEGGHWDRVIRRDSILAPGASVEVETLRASNYRKEASGFKLAADMAPFYLRSRADFGASTNEVMNFVSRWLDFRNKGDTRKSLVSISSSDALKATRETRGMPGKLKDAKVVGAIACIRGRLQGFIMFGSNELVQAHFEPLVGGALFSASAIAARAKNLKVPLPAQTVEKARELAGEFMTRILKASVTKDKLREGETGEAWRITNGRTRGRAVAINGKIVHMAVYPYDPFQHELYAGEVTVEGVESGDAEPAGKKPNDPGTEVNDDERRFLDRNRRRRGGRR